MPKTITTTISIIIAVVILIVAYLKWAFWEPSDITQGSLVYRLKVPEVAKQFPLWGVEGNALYDVRIADGEKPSFTIINYSSSSTFDQLMADSKGLGYECKVIEVYDAVCDKDTTDGKSQQINITETGRIRQVNVQLGGY